MKKVPCRHCGGTAFIRALDGSCWNSKCPSRGPVAAPKEIGRDELGNFFDPDNPHFES